jgi:alpha-1,4-digalacturonate transport system permease protein
MSVLSVLPVLVMFTALQRMLMSGLMAGATKE